MRTIREGVPLTHLPGGETTGFLGSPWHSQYAILDRLMTIIPYPYLLGKLTDPR